MTEYNPTNPLIIQGDRTLLLEVQNPHFAAARAAIAPFAELEKSPEYIHTYRITPLSLWNAAAAGITRRNNDRATAHLRQVPGAAECRRRYTRAGRALGPVAPVGVRWRAGTDAE